jgi:hypothetical protein
MIKQVLSSNVQNVAIKRLYGVLIAEVLQQNIPVTNVDL